jgi:hypothetical protein
VEGGGGGRESGTGKWGKRKRAQVREGEWGVVGLVEGEMGGVREQWRSQRGVRGLTPPLSRKIIENCHVNFKFVCSSHLKTPLENPAGYDAVREVGGEGKLYVSVTVYADNNT